MAHATRRGGCVEKIRQYVVLAQYPATTQHFPLPSPCGSFFPMAHDVSLDSAPVCEDNPSHAVQFPRRSTYSNPWCTPVAGRAASPRCQECYSSVRHYRTVRAAGHEMGIARACGDVCAHGVLWSVAWRVPELSLALYAEVILPGEEARWHGLFSIADKSSSFIGPLIVGLVDDRTGNIRYEFFVPHGYALGGAMDPDLVGCRVWADRCACLVVHPVVAMGRRRARLRTQAMVKDTSWVESRVTITL
ncbi:hypothetical protein BJY52DRAFT_937920 [Lactarius psammicola]|nr:hypothetical protein BJY52DRAFT_937920 [Lactarius psammicola]